MSRTVPWNVKDVSFDARQTAREAAQRPAQSVGDWLDALIADGAHESPLPGTAKPAEVMPTVAASPTVLRASRPDVSVVATNDIGFEMAATGTDGLARRFSAGDRQIVHVYDTVTEARTPASRQAAPAYVDMIAPADTAAETISDTKLSRPLFKADQATSEDRHLKQQMIRDAVAVITRRQAALEADLPPRDNLEPLPIPAPPVENAAVGTIGSAILALEARLANARAERLARPRTAPRQVIAPPPVLDEDASRTFETLGQDIRRAMTDMESGPRSVEPMGAGMGTVVTPRFGERAASDLMSTTALTPAASPPDPDRIWSDVRSLLERFESGSFMDALDRRMEDLTAKVERHLSASSPSVLIKDLSRRVDRLQASIKDPAVDQAALEQLLLGIEERVGKAQTVSADVQHLETMMNNLASRIDATRQQPDPKAITALEAQMERLGERLQRSEASLSSLDAVEGSLRDLFSQLEVTRHATIGAAEHAARTVAHDALRSAMQNPALAGAASGFAEKVVDDVEDLKSQHGISERRTQAALSGLHLAIEKLVERLPYSPSGEQTHAPSRDAGIVAPASKVDASVFASILAVANTVDVKHADQRRRHDPADVELTDGLIEPGEGKVSGRVRTPSSDPGESAKDRSRSSGLAAPVPTAEGSAPFIAAARRAAHAAQASTAFKPRLGVPREGGVGSPSRVTASAMALLERTRAYLTLRRRPLLLSLAGLVLLLGALEIAKVELPGGEDSPAAVAQAPAAVKDVPAAMAEAPAAVPQTAPTPSVADAASGRVSQAVAEPSAPLVTASGTPASEPTARPPVSMAMASPPKSVDVAKITNPFLANAMSEAPGLGEGLKALAVAGDAAAQYEAGLRYVEGRTVARDPKVAAGWFEKAAAQGLPPAQYRLGSAYEKGVGETRDPIQAMTWYGRAADAGNIRAMHNLAVMTAEGAAGKPDYVKAAALFGKAAALGVRDSQFNLAILYARGLGIEQNLGQSYLWFAVAAAQGDDGAAKKRDEVAARLDPKALDAAKAAAETFRAAPSVRAANEVLPPAGGWDALASAPARSNAAGTKAGAAKASTM